VWCKVTGLGQGGEGEFAESSVVPANGKSLPVIVKVVIDFSVLLPEVCTDVEEFLHPDGLPSCTVSEIKFTSSNK